MDSVGSLSLHSRYLVSASIGTPSSAGLSVPLQTKALILRSPEVLGMGLPPNSDPVCFKPDQRGLSGLLLLFFFLLAVLGNELRGPLPWSYILSPLFYFALAGLEFSTLLSEPPK